MPFCGLFSIETIDFDNLTSDTSVSIYSSVEEEGLANIIISAGGKDLQVKLVGSKEAFCMVSCVCLTADILDSLKYLGLEIVDSFSLVG